MAQQTEHTSIVAFFGNSFRLFLCYHSLYECFQQQGSTVTFRTFAQNKLSCIRIGSFRCPACTCKRQWIKHFVLPVIDQLQECRCRSHTFKVVSSLFRFHRSEITHNLLFQTIELIGNNGIECHLHAIIEYIYTTYIIIYFTSVLPVSDGSVPHYLLRKFLQCPATYLKLMAGKFRH